MAMVDNPRPAMPSRRLSCQAQSKDFVRKLPLRRFSLSDEIITSAVLDQSNSLLLNLPCEVQMLLFEALAHAPSQVALALTCKQMAYIASETDLSRAHVSKKYAGLLPKEVFDIPCLMKQLESWMPPTLKLCNHCLTMRPCDPAYWQTVDQCEGNTHWIQKAGWSFRDASWHKKMHNICPSCHVTCALSDFIDCDGCRALGRLGDVNWAKVHNSHRARTEASIRAGIYAT